VKQQEHSAHKQHPVRYTNTEAYTLTHTQTLGQRKGQWARTSFYFWAKAQANPLMAALRVICADLARSFVLRPLALVIDNPNGRPTTIAVTKVISIIMHNE